MSKLEKAVVVLSGGQDSVTCLAWALHHYEKVECITFDYGQRHRIEIQCAKDACEVLGLNAPAVLDVRALSEVSVSALTNTTDNVNDAHPHNENLPASYVPNRNAMFMTLAHAYAQTVGAGYVITGVCQTDYSGYPDCRRIFLDALNVALNLGSETDIQFLAPLMYLNKAQTWALAAKHDALDLVVDHSHTCYEGDHEHKHPWGYGCGECPACVLREKGYNQYALGNLT